MLSYGMRLSSLAQPRRAYVSSAAAQRQHSSSSSNHQNNINQEQLNPQQHYRNYSIDHYKLCPTTLGCGKTSLLNALAGRLPTNGHLNGSITINGQPRQESFRNYTAYVMQDDVLFSALTVRETFMLAATMRLPTSTGQAGRKAVVDGIIQELGLRKAADTFVGGPTVRGVSGGERKRVNIGVQMISNPSILFLDEPTSGLDAFQALSVTEVLVRLAQGGRTLLATVHQPRSTIFSMFHNLLLLSEGRMMYFGRAREAAAYFQGIGFECPQHFNPADFFLDVISMDYRTPELEKESRERVQLLANTYQRRLTDGAITLSKHQMDVAPDETSSDAHTYMSSWVTQFRILLWRANTQLRRDFLPVRISIGQNIFLSILLGLIFRDVEYNEKGTRDFQGVLVFASINTSFTQLFPIILTFPLEKGIVSRERAGKMYHVGAYFMAKVVSEMPFRLLGNVLYITILYWMVGLRKGAGYFFIFFGMLLLQAISTQGLAFFTSSLAPSTQIAMAISPLFLIITILFGGFFINLGSLPESAHWVSYLSNIRWSFQALAINQFRDLELVGCPVDCSVKSDKAQEDGQNNEEAPCDANGVLNGLQFGDKEIWHSVVAQLVLAAGFYFAAYIVLRFVGKGRYLPIMALEEKQKQRKVQTVASAQSKPASKVKPQVVITTVGQEGNQA